jgi:hypothetical protein
MAGHSASCPECGAAVDYWRAHCRRCGDFIGYPNRRAAEAERTKLWERYAVAREDADRRGVRPLLDKLEALAAQSLPVIGMDFKACDDVLRSGKYRTYHQRVEGGERDPAAEQDHSNRAMVEARLFPMYGEHIAYAALSPDGRGLPNYGPVAVRWQATPAYVGRRASLLEENSFIFFETHRLGNLGAEVPEGYRAIWDDRAQVAAVKLAPLLTAATGESDLPGLLLRPLATRKEDEFIEMHIYADEGLDTQDTDMVVFHRPATNSEEHHRADLIREICADRGIRLVE